MPIVILIRNSKLFFKLDILIIEGTNNPKGLGKKPWRFKGFSIVNRDEKFVGHHQGRVMRGAPHLCQRFWDGECAMHLNGASYQWVWCGEPSTYPNRHFSPNFYNSVRLSPSKVF